MNLNLDQIDSESIRAKLKKATSRANWINCIVIILSLYFVYNTVVAIRHNNKLETKLQKLTAKAELLEEANQNLELQKTYYSSTEYQSKALKDKFNLASPDEKVLIIKDLPKASQDSGGAFSQLQELKRLLNE